VAGLKSTQVGFVLQSQLEFEFVTEVTASWLCSKLTCSHTSSMQTSKWCTSTVNKLLPAYLLIPTCGSLLVDPYLWIPVIEISVTVKSYVT